MKISFSSFVVLLILGGMISCKKDNFNYAKDTVGSSRITYFATFNMAGDPYVSVVQGDTYTDAGATASQNGTDLPVTVTGEVDANTVGIYTLTYSATNSDGFPASVSRTIAVLPSAELPGVDISGSYYYISTGANNSTVTKLAPGFYSTTNCWSSATTIPCLFICVDGQNIIMPNQPTGFGELYGTGTLSSTGALTYLVTIESQGIFGTARKWHLK
ncbi:MAG TPA: DUF5011 domain-containing protein [Puia sp.]|jgi:hypothetical protein